VVGRVVRVGLFDVLADRLADHRLAVAELPPGVEPYTTVLTLLADFGVKDDEIASVPDTEMGGGSPYLLSPAEARTRPERLHDDALLLADLLDTSDPIALETLETDTLTDMYVLLSDVQHEADRLRQTAREAPSEPPRSGSGVTRPVRYGPPDDTRTPATKGRRDDLRRSERTRHSP
jgi:hypothetical protein